MGQTVGIPVDSNFFGQQTKFKYARFCAFFDIENVPVGNNGTMRSKKTDSVQIPIMGGEQKGVASLQFCCTRPKVALP